MTTNPTQAQKFFWSGLSRNLETVDDGDIPNDAFTVTIDNLSFTESFGVVNITVDYTITNSTSTQYDQTIVINVNSSAETKQRISLTGSESVSKTYTFSRNISGQYTVTISAGDNSDTDSITATSF